MAHLKWTPFQSRNNDVGRLKLLVGLNVQEGEEFWPSGSVTRLLAHQKASNPRTLNHDSVVKCRKFWAKFIVGNPLSKFHDFGKFPVNQLWYRAVTRNLDIIFWTCVKNIFLKKTREELARIRNSSEFERITSGSRKNKSNIGSPL